MKRYGILLIASFMVMVTAAAKEKDPNADAVLDSVRVKGTLMERYLKAANTDSLQMLFSPNCHLLFPYHEIVESREQVKAYFDEQIRKGKAYRSFTLSPAEIKHYDDIILEIGTCQERFTLLPLKRLYIEEYHYNIVWKRSKSGSFNIRSAVFTPVTKPQPE